MKCENCSDEHNGKYGSGRFCSPKCARGFSTKDKRSDINSRVSKKLTKSIELTKLKDKECCICKKIFTPLLRSNSVCSDECMFERRSKASKKGYSTTVSRNKFKGWRARTKEPSYPEKYFIQLFIDENVTGYEREHNVDKYFIDFAFIDKKIALEIDGKQHELSERKQKDLDKDELLSRMGWQVFRIKWFNPRTTVGKDKLYPQIKNFLKIIRV
jgi:very-short-patch-repair endonuclease